MNNITLYPELTDYIYQYCDNFKTPDERLAGKTILYKTEITNARMKAFLIGKGWYSDAENIKEMMAEGYGHFKKKVAERIFFTHQKELNLNLCPKCSKITRTPWAKQCRFCFHNWH